MKLFSIGATIWLMTVVVGNVSAAHRKRTLQQLINLGMRIGVEREIPDKLVDDLGFEKSLIRKRVGIDDGKHDVTDVFGVLCKHVGNELTPVSLLWQKTTQDAELVGTYSSSNYYSSLTGQLFSVTVGKTQVVDGKPKGSEETIPIDIATKKLFASEMERFLTVPRVQLKGE